MLLVTAALHLKRPDAAAAALACHGKHIPWDVPTLMTCVQPQTPLCTLLAGACQGQEPDQARAVLMCLAVGEAGHQGGVG